MKIKWFLFSFIVVLSLSKTFAQNNVGIGTTTPEPRAILDLESSNKGLLLPQLTKAQRQAIDTVASPASIRGLVVYDIDDKNIWSFDGSNWKSVTPVSAPTPAPQKWSAIGASDITTNSTAFAPMTDMTSTFTPNVSTVYLTFSASGDATLGATPYPQWVLLRCKVNGVVVGGTSTLITDIDGAEMASTWNAQLIIPVTVNVGVANTVTIEWKTEDTNGATPSTVKNYCNTAKDYTHRSLIVTE